MMLKEFETRQAPLPGGPHAAGPSPGGSPCRPRSRRSTCVTSLHRPTAIRGSDAFAPILHPEKQVRRGQATQLRESELLRLSLPHLGKGWVPQGGRWPLLSSASYCPGKDMGH